jgi:hypothetical protein
LKIQVDEGEGRHEKESVRRECGGGGGRRRANTRVADVGAYLYSSLSIDRILPSILKVTESDSLTIRRSGPGLELNDGLERVAELEHSSAENGESR